MERKKINSFADKFSRDTHTVRWSDNRFGKLSFVLLLLLLLLLLPLFFGWRGSAHPAATISINTTWKMRNYIVFGLWSLAYKFHPECQSKAPVSLRHNTKRYVQNKSLSQQTWAEKLFARVTHTRIYRLHRSKLKHSQNLHISLGSLFGTLLSSRQPSFRSLCLCSVRMAVVISVCVALIRNYLFTYDCHILILLILSCCTTNNFTCNSFFAPLQQPGTLNANHC